MSHPTQHIANEFLCIDTANIVATYLDKMADIIAFRAVCTTTSFIDYPRGWASICYRGKNIVHLSSFFNGVRHLTVTGGRVAADWITTLDLSHNDEYMSAIEAKKYINSMPNITTLYTFSTHILSDVHLPNLRKLYCSSPAPLPADFCKRHSFLTHLVVTGGFPNVFDRLEVIGGSYPLVAMTLCAATVRIIYSEHMISDTTAGYTFPNLVVSVNVTADIANMSPNLEEYYLLRKPHHMSFSRDKLKVIATNHNTAVSVLSGSPNIYLSGDIPSGRQDIIRSDGKRPLFNPFIDDKRALLML